ncbi:hypothetical protein CAPTEDRAFT_210422 [Capitella teleta]|uniref:Uncharacterized protein n=1 Tax=Capitella teleta TaxID=283909 RepID=N1PB28_CAPTE|nr:hypothetical protein CAPTEDRAFT_210422 [Capitella teleta]|eukprot:ELU18938.1 hypothetical protein CAPTEDRAFT_210422 [Capitella teleta]
MSLERDHLWARSNQGLPPRSPLLGRTKGLNRSTSGEKRYYPITTLRQQSDCPISPVLLRRALQPEFLSPRMARKKAWYESSCNRAPVQGPRAGLVTCHSLNLPPSGHRRSEAKSHSSDGVPQENLGNLTQSATLRNVHRSWPSSASRENTLKRKLFKTFNQVYVYRIDYYVCIETPQVINTTLDHEEEVEEGVMNATCIHFSRKKGD